MCPFLLPAFSYAIIPPISAPINKYPVFQLQVVITQDPPSCLKNSNLPPIDGFTRVSHVLTMCVIMPLVVYYLKYFGKILLVISISMNEFKMKNVGEKKGQDGGRVRRGDHLPSHRYSRNTSTHGTAPTEHTLNAGRRPQTSQKARNSPRTWVGQKKKEITETKE